MLNTDKICYPLFNCKRAIEISKYRRTFANRIRNTKLTNGKNKINAFNFLKYRMMIFLNFQ